MILPPNVSENRAHLHGTQDRKHEAGAASDGAVGSIQWSIRTSTTRSYPRERGAGVFMPGRNGDVLRKENRYGRFQGTATKFSKLFSITVVGKPKFIHNQIQKFK